MITNTMLIYCKHVCATTNDNDYFGFVPIHQMYKIAYCLSQQT